MTKYADAGYEDPAPRGKNKKLKKGFKVDRRENFKRMMAFKATGKNANMSAREGRAARAKAVVFDAEDRKNYLLTLHKKKNERRVMAFVDSKRKQRKDNAKTRRGQREEARRAYNNYARIPILPNYTYQMPRYAEDDDDAEKDVHYGKGNSDTLASLSADGSRSTNAKGEGSRASTIEVDGNAAAVASVSATPNTRAILRQRRAATLGQSIHAMPSSMTRSVHAQDENGTGSHAGDASSSNKSSKGHNDSRCNGGGSKKNSSSTDRPSDSSSLASASLSAPTKARIDDDYVTVDVRPLFGHHTARAANTRPDSDTDDGSDDRTSGSRAPCMSKGDESSGLQPHHRLPALPSRDFSDLPAIVQGELRRLRQQTKGPAQTKSRVHMMREMGKIRKIKKHSRKGHNKRRSTGKRKNRKK